MASQIYDNYQKILNKIKNACSRSNRDPKTVNLTAVCKRQPLIRVKEAIDLGIKCFGENRVQDAQKRWSKTRVENINLKFIGPLQTNKSESVIQLFDEVQSLDRIKLAMSLSNAQLKLNKKINYVLQINTGNEKQKSGIMANEVEDFMHACKTNYGLNIKGLMCIPPVNENPALHFAFMYKIFKKNKLDTLSMGMSNDFETAIEFGSTDIRIGSELFGQRLEKEEN